MVQGEMGKSWTNENKKDRDWVVIYPRLWAILLSQDKLGPLWDGKTIKLKRRTATYPIFETERDITVFKIYSTHNWDEMETANFYSDRSGVTS